MPLLPWRVAGQGHTFPVGAASLTHTLRTKFAQSVPQQGLLSLMTTLRQCSNTCLQCHLSIVHMTVCCRCSATVNTVHMTVFAACYVTGTHLDRSAPARVMSGGCLKDTYKVMHCVAVKGTPINREQHALIRKYREGRMLPLESHTQPSQHLAALSANRAAQHARTKCTAGSTEQRQKR